MTGSQWMLSSCGQISVLPAGLPSDEALSTGPVYETVVRFQPLIKLLYTHTPCTNVNEAATTLAGHAVRGDACLVVSPEAGKGVSPAVLLDDLLWPAGGAQQRLRRRHQSHLRVRTRLHLADTSLGQPPVRTWHFEARRAELLHGDQGGSAADNPVTVTAHMDSLGNVDGHDSSSSPVAALSEGSLSEGCLSSQDAAGSSAGSPDTLQRQHLLAYPGSPPEVALVGSHHRYRAMRAILGSRNAVTEEHPRPHLARAHGAPGPLAEPPPSLLAHRADGSNRDPAAVTPAALGSDPSSAMWGRVRGEQQPCKSARSSREYDSPWRSRPVAAAEEGRRGMAGREAALPAAAQGGHTSLLDEAARRVQLRRQHEGGDGNGGRREGPQERPELLEAAKGAWMEVDGGAWAGGWAAATAATGAGADANEGWSRGSDGSGRSGNVAPVPDGLVDHPGGGVGGPSGAGVKCGHRHDAPAAELPGRPSAVTVPWVPWEDLAADTVACIAMQLPQHASQVQAMAAVCRGWRDALLGHLPVLRRLTFALDLASPNAATPRPRAPCTAAASHPGGPGAAAAAGTTGQSGVAARSRAPARGPTVGGARGDAGGDDERAFMAAVMLRQYAAGGFLMPSACTRQSDPRTPEGGEGRAAAQSVHVEAVVPRAAVCALPRLLLEAANAANPSALLVVAQLIEGSGDAPGSLRWWRKLAQVGDVMGMFKFGMALYDGSHGQQADPEAAHLWLGRTVRAVLQVDSLAAISLATRQQGTSQSAPLAAESALVGGGQGGRAGPASARGRTDGAASAVLEGKIAALDAPRLRILAYSAIVMGYLEFDGVAGRSTWGLADRSTAVRMFRVAEECGLAEASAVLGWLYNTGQY